MTFHCPANYVFQLSTKTCLRSSVAYCYTIDCSSKKNKWAVMPYNTGYYAFCGAMSTIMYRCEDADNFYFNTATNQCQYNCKANANYEDRTNCTQYISCNWVNSAYQVSVIPCPPNCRYDSVAQSCVSGNCTAAISTPAPPSATTLPPPTPSKEPPKTSGEKGTIT